MSDREHEDRQRTRDAVRRLPRPVADPAFRERLGRQFAEGDLPPARRPRSARLVWVAAAAVLAVAASLLLVADREPRWLLVEPRDADGIEVDGLVLSGSRAGERLLRPGARVRVPSGSDVEL